MCVECQDGSLVIANIFTLRGGRVDLFLEDVRRDVLTFNFCFILCVSFHGKYDQICVFIVNKTTKKPFPIATEIQYTINHLNYSLAAVMDIRVFAAQQLGHNIDEPKKSHLPILSGSV